MSADTYKKIFIFLLYFIIGLYAYTFFATDSSISGAEIVGIIILIFLVVKSKATSQRDNG